MEEIERLKQIQQYKYEELDNFMGIIMRQRDLLRYARDCNEIDFFKRIHFLNNYNILRYHHLCHNIFEREDADYEGMIKDYLYIGNLIAKARNYKDVWEWYHHILDENSIKVSRDSSSINNGTEQETSNNSQAPTENDEAQQQENAHGMLVLKKSSKIIAM